jgi:hypothetical protein
MYVNGHLIFWQGIDTKFDLVIRLVVGGQMILSGHLICTI